LSNENSGATLSEMNIPDGNSVHIAPVQRLAQQGQIDGLAEP
jgi:hypothetical protein